MADPAVAAQSQALPWPDRLARALAGLGLWRALALSAVFGALAAGALPPLYALPLLWIAFPGLLWLLDGARSWLRAFLTGWAFGLGYFAAGLYWVGHSFLVDAERFGALMPFAVGALAAGMALFPGLATVAVWLNKDRGLSRVLLFAAAWLASEWLRAWAFTGFPWNLIGTVWTFSDATLQFASIAGVWGLSLVTVVSAAAPSCLRGGEAGGWRRYAVLVLALLAPAALWGFGALRLAAAPELAAGGVPGVHLRVVQPNIDQRIKWQSDLRAKHVADQMALSETAGAKTATHVIWSETAVPFLLPDMVQVLEAIREIVPPGGLLLTGAPRRAEVDGEVRLWNSLFAIDENGHVAAVYDKRHLVPFGEYVPLRSILPLEKLTQGVGDFTPGTGPRTLSLPGLPEVSVLICYEVIFPGRVVDPGSDAKWLLNVTNDAWFGTSSGPYQHFAAARLRAVEEGLPLVRAANTGISAVVDSYGRVVARLGLNRSGVIDAALPDSLEKRTL
ncbi:MAG: apolipoprotein N-acyltransferase, partial [Kiloniellales bacterium]|nr:apolipoprotein N-acyltransferase [Kiloniellales bacterium]